MSLYTREKNNIVCPDQIGLIQTEFQQQVKQSKIIISIGVKPDPLDKHIWDYVSDCNAYTYFVGNNESCKYWIANYHPSKGEVLGNRFDHSFNDICSLLDSYLM
jgi:hypothetical protein